MTFGANWLKRLADNSKGIWGIASPMGSSLQADVVLKARPVGCETKFLTVINDEGILRLCDEQKNIQDGSFLEILCCMTATAIKSHRHLISIVVDRFHDASPEQQCNLIKSARRAQESSTNIDIQVIFFGTWNFFSFFRSYRNLNGQTTSPPLESRNIIRVQPWKTEKLLSLLHENRLISISPTDIDLVACDFLIEQTGGDEYLTKMTVDYLVQQSGKWTGNVEQILVEILSSPDVIANFSQRINSLDSASKTELCKLMRAHFLVREYNSIESEQLWLSGLVRRRDLDGGKQCIQVAGPLINTLIRYVLVSELPNLVASPTHLCFERESVSTAAYRRIAQIENMLRNLIVSEWHLETGGSWSEKLGETKTSTHGLEEEADLIKLILSVVTAVKDDSFEDKVPVPFTEVIKKKTPQQETVLQSALGWQQRLRESHAVELSNDNLMHFLTTESLVNVFRNKKSGFYGDGKLFRKEELLTALGEYIMIRSAVAHNQPVKLNTITRLDVLQRKFIDWITFFNDKPVDP